MLSLGFDPKLGIQCMTAFTSICDIKFQCWHSMSSLGFNHNHLSSKKCVWPHSHEYVVFIPNVGIESQPFKFENLTFSQMT